VIIFYGWGEDTPLRRCADLAADLGIDHRFVDQHDLRQHELRVETGMLRMRGELIPLDTVSAVYARPLELPRGCDGPRETAFHETFVEWLDYSDARVVNRPEAMHSTTSKPYQAQLVTRAGFAVPDTLVTDDPAVATAFRDGHGRVIFKSVSGIRSIVTELDERAARRLPLIRALPVLFQEYVPGVDVRVHVVGDATFATEVVGRAEPATHELPGPVATRCAGLARTLGLSLCGIDLRRRPDGEYVCFGVNPMPAYSPYEAEAGKPISRSLVELLRLRAP